MIDINDILRANTIDEIINIIFLSVYNQNESYGYSIELKKMEKEEFNKLHRFYKLPFLVEKKAKDIILGETNISDNENRLQESRYILIKALKDIFTGSKNDKLENDLKINSIDDIKRIAKDKELTRRLCNYIFLYVELCLKTYTHKKDNPDYEYIRKDNQYKKINYVYLDKAIDEDENKIIQIPYEEITNSTGEMTKYILKEYFKYLTNKQQIFVKNAIEFGIIDGKIRNYQNEILYTKQDIQYYKNSIKKNLEKKIEQDINIDSIGNRWHYRDQKG